jgi:O-antigen ligase
MTIQRMTAGRPAETTAQPSRDWRLQATWAALFLNVLPFTGDHLLPLPAIVGQLIAQGALPVALVLALLANPRGLVRPNVHVVLFSLLCLLAVMVSLHNPFLVSSTYRALRFSGYVLVLWLLSPFWGRRDLALLRCHRVCLVVVLSSVALGAVISPGKAFAFDGRLAGIIWPVFPTAVAHMAAILAGTSALLWMCRVISGRNAVATIVLAAPVLVATHTRTALLAGAVGLVCASASLLLARSRARRTWIWGGVLSTAVFVVFASELMSWLLRGQTASQASGLTGRTTVWSQVLDHPRSLGQQLFGSGMSNLSFNGSAIDSNWVGTYLDLGLVGAAIQILLLAILLLTALTRPSGPRRAVAIFLIVYCIFASITETGMSGPSAVVLDLAVASALIARPSERPTG